MEKFALVFILTGAVSLSGCAAKVKGNDNQAISESSTSYKESTHSTSSTVSSSSTEKSTPSHDVSNSSTEETTSGSSTIHTLEANSEETTSTAASGSDILSNYTDDQIEYARIWLQLGANQEIDSLYVQRIPAGTPIVPSISGSAVFPENVIQLSGGRRVDGSVTYGSNHNGTINVYNVPINLYWEFDAPKGILDPEVLRPESQKVLNNTKLVSVDVGDPVQVKRLIQLENDTGDIDLSFANDQ